MLQCSLWHIFQSHRAAALIIVGCLVSQTAGAADRLPAHTLFDPGNRDALANYVRERLLKIHITARNTKTKQVVTALGTGFLVSTQGHAITAAHVLEPYTDSANFEPVATAQAPKSVQIEKAVEDHFVSMDMDTSFTPQVSKRDDIALFKVKTETDLRFQTHFCIDTDDPRGRISDPNLDLRKHPVVVAAWRHPDNKLQNYPITITDTSGPTLPDDRGNDLSERWVAKEQFHNSMSGGAILFDGKVVGVVVSGLQDESTGRNIVTGANFISLLHLVDNSVDWRHRSEICNPASAGDEFTEFARLSDFLSGTEEGSLAWVFPSGIRPYWALDKGHDYYLRRRDLDACSEAKADLQARFVLNHFSRCARADVEAATFYGVQVVPIIKEDEAPIPEVWLFRNANLLMRRRSGEFYVPEPLNDPQDLDGNLFNEVIKEVWLQSPEKPLQECGAQLDESQCRDLASVEVLEKYFGRRWHGFTRRSPDARSTVWGTKWIVPQKWFGDTATVKNFILRYRGTDSPFSFAPVNFAVCVPPNWSGMRIRTFSPERCAAAIERKITFRDD